MVVEKRQNNRTTGYLFILAGMLGIGARFWNESPFDTFGIIKIVLSVIAIVIGIWTVLKRRS
jgi:hypothetical protein